MKRPKLKDMNERELAILKVLCEADEPLYHRQIVQRLTPWYDRPASFKASVSSMLGIMKAKRLVKSRNVPMSGRPIYVAGRQIIPTKRVWSAVDFSHARPPVQNDLHNVPRYHTGGIVRGYQVAAITEMFKGHYPAFIVDPGLGKAVRPDVLMETIIDYAHARRLGLGDSHPHTDDMVQMIEDIERVEPLPITLSRVRFQQIASTVRAGRRRSPFS